MSTGIVFNIQRFTIHDGPGMRTELFLKGCPLKCRWCSNPESQKMEIEPGIYKSKCIGERQCSICGDICVNKALIFKRNKLLNIDNSLCNRCMECADGCPADAIKIWGKKMSVDECLDIILRDKGYYDDSGGGITVSGGEPLLQADFVSELFDRCQKEGIQTCLESTFAVSKKEIDKVLPYTDIIISDLKMMNSEKHKEYTGMGNELIHENLRYVSTSGKRLILRIPVIPHINDDHENISKTADYIINDLGNKVDTLQLLSFMRLGVEKYESLGRDYPMQGLRFNRPAFQKKINNIANYFNNRGIHCLVGTKEKMN